MLFHPINTRNNFQEGGDVSGRKGPVRWQQQTGLSELEGMGISSVRHTRTLQSCAFRQFWHQKSSGLLLSGHEVPTEISLAGVNFLISQNFPSLCSVCVCVCVCVCVHMHASLLGNAGPTNRWFLSLSCFLFYSLFFTSSKEKA